MTQNDLEKLLDYIYKYKANPPQDVISLLMKVVGLILLAHKKNPKVREAFESEIAQINELESH